MLEDARAGSNPVAFWENIRQQFRKPPRPPLITTLLPSHMQHYPTDRRLARLALGASAAAPT